MSIHDWVIAETPISVIDVETTGFNPGRDRVVEVAVWQLLSGRAPKLVFDSLIDPNRRVSATSVHGLRYAELESAPRFEHIAAELGELLSGSVIAAHHAAFDLRFLAFELAQVEVDFDVPYLCTMELRPLLGLGDRCSLDVACEAAGITGFKPHAAADDAGAAACLLAAYLGEIQRRGLSRFGDLARLGHRKFFDSWHRRPLHPSMLTHLTQRQPRYRPAPPETTSADNGTSGEPSSAAQVANSFPAYSFALLEALSDFVITDEELERLAQIRQACGLSDEQVRAVHASVYTWTLSQFSVDGCLDDQERQRLQALHGCLRQLGWAPGD